MEQNKAKLSLIISMIIFGTIGIFRRYIPLPSGFLAMSRGIIGAIFLSAAVFLGKKKFDKSAIKKNLALLLISGGMIGFNWILLFEAYNYTSVATATLCYYAAPIFIIIASPFAFGEKLTVKKLLCIASAVLGMVLVSGILREGFSGIREMKGILFGIGAALLYAGVIILNKKIGDMKPFDKTTIQLFSASAVILPYVLLAEDIDPSSLDLTSAVMLLIVGIIHTGAAYALYFGSLSSLSAQTAAIFSYIDPVVAIILSALILRENIGIEGGIGAILILGAALVSDLPPLSKSKKA